MILQLQRRPDWTGRWAEFIKDSLDLAADLQMNWADINCTQFSGQGVEALTDVNPYENGGWVDKFTDAEEATKAIRTAGFKTLDDVIASLFPEIPLAFVWPGDIVLVKTEPWGEMSANAAKTMPHGVVLADPPYFYSVTEKGLGRGPLHTQAVRCFAVGHSAPKIEGVI